MVCVYKSSFVQNKFGRCHCHLSLFWLKYLPWLAQIDKCLFCSPCVILIGVETLVTHGSPLYSMFVFTSFTGFLSLFLIVVDDVRLRCVPHAEIIMQNNIR